MDPIIVGYSRVYPQPFLVGLPLLFILLIVLAKQKRGPLYLVGFTLFWLYLLVAVNLVFFPILLPAPGQAGLNLENIQWIFSRVNLIPFYYGDLALINARVLLYEIIGNFALTIPIGLALPVLFRVPANRIPRLALGAGILFEGGQLALALVFGSLTRSVDINDLLLNAAGVLCGYALYRLLVSVPPLGQMLPGR